MAVTALVMFIVLISLVMGVRVLIQVRRTGDHGVRRKTGTHSPGQRWGESLGAIGYLGLGIASPVAAMVGLDPVVDSSTVEYVGLVVAAAGIVATFTAQLAMGNSWRVGVDPDERTPLITSGPFRLVRNPVTTTAVLTCAGLVLMVPNVVGLVGFAAFVTANQILIRLVEEPYLIRIHGSDYVSYAGRVGRLVPGLGRLS
ncbi:methyltransferase family protein [Streptomyces sp. 184]|uniref:methyltransferase family protein n=1 Tax=Streptomyces sp. 184 TaxID=1827526 RepID=UPI0038924DF0